MTIDEHIEQAKDCAKGMTFHADSMGWRVTQLALAEEVERLRARIAELEKQSELVQIGCQRRWEVLADIHEKISEEIYPSND